MNTRTASDNRPKPSAGSTASDVDKQLAFIDNVCSLLIESRFGYGFSYSPFSKFTPAADDGKDPERRWMPLHEFIRLSPLGLDSDPILASSHFTPPETARPTALAKRSSSPAARNSSKGVQAVFARTDEISGTHFAVFLSAFAQPRGSPF
jgi:hypothetical protein